MPSTKHAGRSELLLSRRQIERLIADGRSIIIVDQRVLKVDAWMRFHPGGDKAIMHMIGRDATDEVNALHSAQARKQMERYRIGRIEGRWKNFLPPIQGGRFRAYIEGCQETDEEEEEEEERCQSSSESSRTPSPVFDIEEVSSIRRRDLSRRDMSSASSVSSIPDEDDGMTFFDAKTKEHIDLDLTKYPSLDPATQDEVVRKYRLLEKRIRTEGLYKCNYSAYAIESCRYTFLFCMFLLCLRLEWYGTRHMGITHGFNTDTVIGILIADFIGGLSLTWWKRNHNVHHIVTNSPEHDPDIEHMPFFAISHRFFESLKSTYYERVMTYDAFAKFVIPYQSYLYYPILLFGRFNLYRLSWEHLLLGLGPKKGPAAWHRYLEIAGQIFFWYWYGTQKLVQQFCSEVGIPYALYGFVDGSKEVIGRLHEVGRQAAILAKCQRTIAERGDILHGH
ncbi:Delta 8-(E)-sphingolipid desaturase [Hyphodiscus hymeniophilus]|uniref:Delta 8-(E)-sphingolipid desaturase n=1 Tax=Hyphodiscus hymeniophilus TaxID=353542 RepID=A0A9P6VGH8_9HELO|nr:Delta 8-(E)-sphingolipid desaturase [Hyphodiscus hymeniophilus]